MASEKFGVPEIDRAIKQHDAHQIKARTGYTTPMIAPSHKGLLHKKLGVPQGEKIPASKISKALHSKSPALRKEANFARNFGKR